MSLNSPRFHRMTPDTEYLEIACLVVAPIIVDVVDIQHANIVLIATPNAFRSIHTYGK
jgi:hypothetical protein